MKEVSIIKMNSVNFLWYKNYIKDGSACVNVDIFLTCVVYKSNPGKDCVNKGQNKEVYFHILGGRSLTNSYKLSSVSVWVLVQVANKTFFELRFTNNILALNKECNFYGINLNPCRTKMITGKPNWKPYLWPFDITCSACDYVTLVRDRHFPIWSCFPTMWTITIIFPRSDTQYLVLVQCLHYSQIAQRKSQMFWRNVYVALNTAERLHSTEVRRAVNRTC